nr:MAG TPA: optinuerin [Caudoviricetes sp.]
MSKYVKCPSFGCDGVGIPVDTKKKFSFGKAVVGKAVGGVLWGPTGAVIGAATGINGKNGKTKFVCQKCGKVFEKKI